MRCTISHFYRVLLNTVYMQWAFVRVVLYQINLRNSASRWLSLQECGNESSGSVKCGEFLD
jgi:hypothetical protein